MCVYGEMFGIRLSRLLPMRKLRGSVFKMCVYGEKQIKMCVYGEGFGVRLSDSCFRCENKGFRCLKCVFMGKIRLKCVFMGKGSEFACQTPASDAKIRVFGV